MNKNQLNSLNNFEIIIGRLKNLGVQISVPIQLHKFKGIFREEYPILIQSIEADAAINNLNYDQQLEKLKGAIRRHIVQNKLEFETGINKASINLRNKFQSINSRRNKRYVTCWNCNEQGYYSYECKRERSRNNNQYPTSNWNRRSLRNQRNNYQQQRNQNTYICFHCGKEMVDEDGAVWQLS